MSADQPAAARQRMLLNINGESHALEIEPGRRLLDVLRHDLGFTAAKEGCGVGRCGACTVMVEDAAVPACMVMAYQVDGARITTVEGLRQTETFEHVARVLLDHGALQCGYCIPGLVTALTATLFARPAASLAELENALAGNLCRCSGYAALRRALQELSRNPVA